MKHSIVLSSLAAGMLCLTACSNDEVVEKNQSGAIGFTTMTTRGSAGEVTTANMDFFRVVGFFRATGSTDALTALFPDGNSREVKKTNGVWKYEPLAYWAPGNDYYFMAVSTNVPGVRPYTYTFPTDNYNDLLTNFNTNKGIGTLTFDNTNGGLGNGYYDLVYAYATRTTDATLTNTSAVDLTFNHLLSRVRFQFKNAMPTGTGYTFTVTELKLSNSPAAGSITFDGTNTWTADATKGTADITSDTGLLENLAAEAKQTTEPRFMIPCTAALTISFKVEVKLNGTTTGTYTKTVTLASDTYKQATSYQFNADLTLANVVDNLHPIEFNVTAVNGWPDWGEGTSIF